MSLNEAPGPIGKMGTGLKDVRGQANTSVNYITPEIDAIAVLLLPLNLAHPSLRAAICECDRDHQTAPKHLLDRFYATVSHDHAGKHLVHLARVTFHARGKFQLNQNGTWAIVIPVLEYGEVVDLAAFDLDDHEKRALLLGHGFCVGLHEAQFEARHDRATLRTHFDAWSFLRAGGEGALPVDWLDFLYHLKRSKTSVGAESEADADLIAERMEALLKPPSVFVVQREDA